MDAIDPEHLRARLGRDHETAFEPVGDVYLHHDPDLGCAEVLYVAADPYPPEEFWPADGSRGRLVDGVSRLGPEAAFVLPLELTEDGASIALLPRELADRGKALVPPENLASAYAAGKIGFPDLMEWAEGVVAAFDAWRRGEVYGIVRETLSFGRASSGRADVAPSWDVLDLAGARRALREVVDRREAELAPAGPRP